MSVAPTDEQEIDALAKKLLAVLQAEQRPILFHMSALAVVIATVAVSSGQWKDSLNYIRNLARQIIMTRRNKLA